MCIRAIEQVPSVHECRRAATIEVDRVPRAERQHQPCEFAEFEAGVDPGATAVTADGQELPVADAERAPRMASEGDVGVELPGARREALAVTVVDDDPAIAHKQWAGLH